MSKNRRNTLHLVKALHTTVQNIFAGIAVISQNCKNNDDEFLVWEIKNKENQPTVTISYKKPSVREGGELNSERNCGTECTTSNAKSLPVFPTDIDGDASLKKESSIQEDKENGNENGKENVTCFPNLLTEDDKIVIACAASQEKNHGKSFMCNYCGKYFLRLEDKTKHEKTHTREKPYPCSYCEKSFARFSHKKSHELTHTGEKPHPCRFCDKSFAQVHDKTRHERIHTGEKPYSCSFCNKPFARLSHKKAHERIHTGEKPYTCKYCSRCFAQLGHKKAHEASHVKKSKKIMKYATINLYANDSIKEKEESNTVNT